MVLDKYRQLGQITQRELGGQTQRAVSDPIPDYEYAGYEALKYEDMPGYDKLGDGEKWVMGSLAGVSDFVKPFADSQLGQWAGKNLGFVGNILGVLDIAAEGIERTIGFGAQMLHAQSDPQKSAEFWSNIGAAWEAGSMWADVTNMPKFRNGKLEMTYDLPGIEGLVEARQKIADGAKLEDVRTEYYSSLGALAIRGQIQDMLQHIIGDPLNFVMPVLKPVQRLHALRNGLVVSKALPETLVAQADNLARLTDIATSVKKLSDLEKLAPDELAAFGAKIGKVISPEDVRALSNIAADPAIGAKGVVAELQRLKKGVDDFGTLSWAEQKFLQLTGGIPGSGNVDELTTALKEARKAGDLDLASTLERQLEIAKNLAPKTKAGKLLQDIGRSRFNPLALTPQARAHEFMNTALENVRNYVLPNASAEEITRAILRAADGTLGPEFGHMVVSTEGRQLAGMFRMMASTAEDSMGAFKRLWYERGVLENMSQVLGENIHNIAKQLQAGEAAGLFARFTDKLKQVPEAKAAFDNLLNARKLLPEQFTADMLNQIGKTIAPADGKIIPYSLDMFKYDLMDKLVDGVAKIGILQFGVKHQGFLNTMSDAFKAGQNLAFLRLNPSYPIRNGFNNVFTMVARGVFGNVSGADIEKFIQRIGGLTPSRFGSGFGYAEVGADVTKELSAIAEQALSKGAEDIFQTIRGKGRMQNFTNALNSLGKKADGKAAKWDFGAMAAQIEKWSSQRAYATSYMRAWPTAFRPTPIGKFSNRLSGLLGDDLAKTVERSISGVMSEAELDAALLADNLNITVGQIRNIANEKFGADMGRILGEETVLNWSERLSQAAKGGRTAIDDTVSIIRREFQESMEDAHERAIVNFMDEQLALAKTQGPGAIPQLWGNIQDDFYASSERHVADLSRQIEDAAKIKDASQRNLAYRSLFDDNDAYFKRMWDRQDARFKAIQEAAKATGQRGYGGIANEFRAWRKGWQGFFEQRKQMWSDFSAAIEKGEEPAKSALQIQTELNGLYRQAARGEAAATRRIDESLARLLPKDQRDLWMSWRTRVSDVRAQDRELVLEFRASLERLPRSHHQKAWTDHWKRRNEMWKRLYDEETAGLAALQGNPGAQLRFAPGAEAYRAEETAKLTALDEAAKKLGFEDGSSMAGAQALNPEDARFLDVPDDIMRQIELINQAPPEASFTGLANFHKIVPQQLYLFQGADELMYSRGFDALDSMREAATDAASRPAFKFGDIPQAAQGEMKRWAAKVRGELKDAKLVASKMGEFGRDAALLNYTRRYNFDTWLSTIVPYEFWPTHSIFNWALHSIDRPAMLSTFMRLQKFAEQGFRPEQGLPTRLKGLIRIPVPFLPDWMGNDIFINPSRLLMPFDQWSSPFEQSIQQEQRDVGAALRRLEEMQQQGQISQAEYGEAMKYQSGATWERAIALARQDDTEGRLNGFDFATMILNPHAPLMWAYNLSQGTPEKIGPALPLTRTIRGVAGLLGIDTNEAPVLSIPAKIRQAIGLHPFDQWDEYRINRMLVNMVADKAANPATGQPITIDEARRAWIEKSGPLYAEAKQRMLKEFGVNAMGSALGLPVNSYPTGEETVRQETKLYEAAWARYEKSGDYDQTVGKFLDEHPEYELRLGLFKKPEEQLNVFLTDMVWDRYNSLPTLNKREVREQMPDFVATFLDSETRNTESLTPEQLGVYLKMMGATPVGTLGMGAIPISLAPREIAQVAQFFYDYRNQNFGGYFELQDAYFNLKEGNPRRQFLRQNPALSAYWSWRNEFLKRNPRVADYVSEDYELNYSSVQEAQQAYSQPFSFSPGEYRTALGSSAWEIVVDYLQTGDFLPANVRERITELASELGVEYSQLLAQMRQSISQ